MKMYFVSEALRVLGLMLREERNFHVHHRSDGRPIFREPIDAPAFCIAFSSNDKFVALRFSSELWVYEIQNKRKHRHPLPFPADSKLDSQRVCFSADSEKVIVVTRNLDGHVYTYTSECMRTTTDPHFPSITIPKVRVSPFTFI